MIKNFVVLFILLSKSVCLIGQEDTKSVLIAEIFELNGVYENHFGIVDRIIERYKIDFSQMHVSFWDAEKLNLKRKYNDVIINRLMKLYDENLTHAQIEDNLKLFKLKDQNYFYPEDVLLYEDVMMVAMETSAAITQSLTKSLEDNNRINYKVSKADCERFKNGKFLMLMGDGSEVHIEKKDSIQTSIFGEHFIKFNLKYFPDCSYYMTLIETNFEPYKNDIGNMMEIYPYSITGNNMKYKSIMGKHSNAVIFGEIIKID